MVTTGGNGNWSASCHVGNGSGGFTQLASVADLKAVTIGSVGIGVYNADGAAKFQSFELGVVAGDTTAPQHIMPMGGSITVGYQWSKDLHAFHDNLATDGGCTTVGLTIQADTPEAGTTTVTATVTGTSCDRFFLRVEVTGN